MLSRFTWLILTLTLNLAWSSVANAGFWSNAAGGLWSTPANWSDGIVANGANFGADFSEIDITTPVTVHLDSSRIIGSLFFGDTAPGTPGSWILDNNGSAGNVLTLDGVPGSQAIYVSNSTVTINAVLAGTQGFIKGNNGTLMLNGANTFTGGVTILSGTVQLGNAGALNSNGANAVTFGPGSIGKLNLNGNSITLSGLSTDATVGGPLVQNNSNMNATLTINNAADNTFGGELRNGDGGSGVLSLTKTGAGTLNLAGANTYTGGTTLSAGTLAVGSDSALGSGTLNIMGGTIQADGASRVVSSALTVGGNFIVGGPYDLTLSSPTTLTANRRIRVAGTGIATLSGNIGQDVAGRVLQKFGAGTLRLSGANTFSGGVTMGDEFNSGGTLLIGNSPALGSGPLNVFNGTVEADGGPRFISNTVVHGSEFGGGTLTIDGTQDLTLTNLSGDSFELSAMIKNGTGTLTLDNHLMGRLFLNVTVNAGTLSLIDNLIFSGPAIANGETLVIGDGTGVDTVREHFLPFGHAQLEHLGLSHVVVNSSGVLDLNGRPDRIYSLTLNGGLATTGTGTLTLLGGGPVTTLPNAQTATISGNLDLNAVDHTFDVANGAAAIDLDVSAKIVNGSLTKGGAGTLRLSGNNTFAGGATVTGGTLLVASSSALGPGTLTINGGAVDLSTFASGVSLVNLNAGSLSLIGNLTVGTGGLLGTNPTIATNQTVTLTGTTTIDPAGTLTLNGGTLNTEALAGTGTFNFINGALGITGAAGLTIGSGNLVGTNISLGAGDHLNVTNALHIAGAGHLTNPGGNVLAGNVLIDAGGLWTVSNDVQSVGTGLLNHGTLVFINTTINGPVNSPGGSTVTIVGGVTFNQLFSGAGQFFGPGTTTFNGGYNPGDSPATVNFEGSAALGGSNVLSMELGGTAIGAEYDHLHLAGNLALGGALQVSLVNGFGPSVNDTFDLLDWGSIAGTFSTVNLPLQNGSTPLRWDASQLYTNGQVKLISASANVVNKTIYWTGNVNFFGQFQWDVGNTTNWTDLFVTERFFNGDSVVFNDTVAAHRNVTLNATVAPATVTISNASGNNFTISGTGSIGGAGTVIKNGAGTLTLATSNSFGGGTTVNGGTLVVGHVNALGTGGLSIGGSATTKLQAGLIAPVQLPSLTIAGGATLDVTDLNGVVDNMTDYDLWSTGFAHQGGALSGYPASLTLATDVQPVPEPSALILTVIGVIYIVATSRRARILGR